MTAICAHEWDLVTTDDTCLRPDGGANGARALRCEVDRSGLAVTLCMRDNHVVEMKDKRVSSIFASAQVVVVVHHRACDEAGV